MKAELARNVSSEIIDAAAVHMTTDIWSSITNDAYIGVTATYVSSDWQLKTRTLANAPMEERHTTANIASRLQETAASWAIQDKVKTVVYVGASNMREVASVNTWVDVGCSAHKLHLAVTGAMGIDKVTNSTISKWPHVHLATRVMFTSP